MVDWSFVFPSCHHSISTNSSEQCVQKETLDVYMLRRQHCSILKSSNTRISHHNRSPRSSRSFHPSHVSTSTTTRRSIWITSNTTTWPIFAFFKCCMYSAKDEDMFSGPGCSKFAFFGRQNKLPILSYMSKTSMHPLNHYFQSLRTSYFIGSRLHFCSQHTNNSQTWNCQEESHI